MPDPSNSQQGDNFVSVGVAVDPGTTLAETERQVILSTLERHDGNKRATAAELGVSLKTLYSRLKDYSADQASDG